MNRRSADNPQVSGHTRVVIADDDILLREGLASLLTSRGFDVVGQVADPSSLVASVSSRRLGGWSGDANGVPGALTSKRPPSGT